MVEQKHLPLSVKGESPLFWILSNSSPPVMLQKRVSEFKYLTFLLYQY